MSELARLSIGEFSRLTWLSPKALRLYERRGLLVPDLVDDGTGYRFYLASQAERARTIALLRRVGMPLERIGAVLDSIGDERRVLLERYRSETVLAHERAISLLDGLTDDLVGSRPLQDAPAVRRRSTAAWTFLSRTVRTTAADLPSQIERSVASLIERAGPVRDALQPFAVLYHGEVGWESDGPIEVRIPVTDPDAADGSEPTGVEVFVDVPRSSVQFPTILRAFDAVRHAATRDGDRPLGPPREIYSNGPPFTCRVAQRVDPGRARSPARER